MRVCVCVYMRVCVFFFVYADDAVIFVRCVGATYVEVTVYCSTSIAVIAICITVRICVADVCIRRGYYGYFVVTIIVYSYMAVVDGVCVW